MTMKTIRKFKAQTRAKAIGIAVVPFLFLVLLSMHLKLKAWNVRGLLSSTMCLANLLRDTDFDFVILSEHKLPQMYSNYLDCVDNKYFSFTKCESQISNKLHVKYGVSIMQKKSFLFSVKEIEVNSTRIVSIECKVNTHDLLYIEGVYILPENNIEA